MVELGQTNSLRQAPVGRHARVLALQSLYAYDVRKQEPPGVVELLDVENSASDRARHHAERLVAGIVQHIENLDESIAHFAPALPVNYLAIVDRNILRMAIYELRYRDQVPARVVINEATEIASIFGSESSARFVNGVLGSVAEDHRTRSGAPSGTGTDQQP